MEDILDLDADPSEAPYPLVCCDESPDQLVRAVREPRPAMPGPPVRYDDESRRQGRGKLCMFLAPRRGWRHVQVTDRRPAQDCAHCRQDLVDLHVPQASVSSVGLDNLNPHTPAALSATVPPAEACRIGRRLDFH